MQGVLIGDVPQPLGPGVGVRPAALRVKGAAKGRCLVAKHGVEDGGVDPVGNLQARARGGGGGRRGGWGLGPVLCGVVIPAILHDALATVTAPHLHTHQGATANQPDASWGSAPRVLRMPKSYGQEQVPGRHPPEGAASPCGRPKP